MPHLFFFSYARSDGNDKFLEQFFEDLSDCIRSQLGLDKDVAVGFVDHQELQLGADWENELNEALQSCPVLVSMYSPAYFNSPYCGKEWEVFRRRQKLFVENARANNQEVNSPPVIKPVIWIPLMKDQVVPEAVRRLQYYMGDPEADHNKVGLQRMRKRHNNYEESYDNFIENLKNEILTAQRLGLPRLVNFAGLDQIDNAFEPSPPENGNGGNPPPPVVTKSGKGPQYVRFVFIAGNPTEFPEGARPHEFYLNYGGPDWKPYYPDAPSPIMWLAQKSAVDVGIYSDQLPFTKNLAKEVRDAETDGNLVVLFVDCWTAELASYQPILREFDRNSYFNCSIFIPWNGNDPQGTARREALLQLVRDDIFRRWSLYANAGLPFFRDSIESVRELEDQLKDTLQQLRWQVGKGVMEKATKDTIPRRIETDIARPILAHKPV